MYLSTENVILVNENDEAVGEMEKIEAHQKAELHRAFSVFVFNSQNQFLLQKRNFNKYHSGGLWSNTCCGHPRPGEATKNAAERRLFEEMGFKVSLTKKFDFIYRTDFENGLAEHELDHVFYGTFDNNPEPNPMEVEDWKYINLSDMILDIKNYPQNYTVWFKICLDKIGKILA